MSDEKEIVESTVNYCIITRDDDPRTAGMRRCMAVALFAFAMQSEGVSCTLCDHEFTTEASDTVETLIGFWLDDAMGMTICGLCTPCRAKLETKAQWTEFLVAQASEIWPQAIAITTIPEPMGHA